MKKLHLSQSSIMISRPFAGSIDGSFADANPQTGLHDVADGTGKVGFPRGFKRNQRSRDSGDLRRHRPGCPIALRKSQRGVPFLGFFSSACGGFGRTFADFVFDNYGKRTRVFQLEEDPFRPRELGMYSSNVIMKE